MSSKESRAPFTFSPGFAGSWLYLPAGNEKAGAVVVLHGSDGGWSGWAHWQALLLAGQGFIAIAPNYSKGGNLWHAGDIHAVPLDETAAVVERLRHHPRCNGRVGLFGGSRGAEHALLLANLMAQHAGDQNQSAQPHEIYPPDAVAAHAPHDHIVAAFFAEAHRPGANPSESEHYDRPLPAWAWYDSSAGLEPGTPISLSHYKGPLFLSHGEADDVWSADCTRALAHQRAVAGQESATEVYLYPGEGHSLGPIAATLQAQRLKAFFTRCLS
ncbi:MAG: alpha/beta hydrolase [Pseudomonadota bacterium]